ncbi:SLC13 family permease [Evtepia sp.]|uniref:SLC13 family permease n=1 Tax=Evtepia sp. TaxID=2773933 RepID=UPI003F147CE8
MLSQILSISIALVMFILVLWGKYPRHLVTLSAGGLMIVLVFLLSMGSPAAVWEALSVNSFLKFEFWFSHIGITEFNTGINWSTILFLSGMMIMVEEMSDAGFFDWISLWLAQKVRFRPVPLLVCFMVLSALLSMFVDSITVILFMVVATIRLARFLKFDPVPLVLAEIFSANLGGAATMSGDPPNIILGTSLGLGFWDFIQNNGVICLAGFAVVLVYFVLVFRTKLGPGIGEAAPELLGLNPGDAIPNREKFRESVLIFAGVILLIVTHTATGLTMPTIGVMAAAVTLACTKYPRELLKLVDWKTIGFIIGLFLVASGLEQTHVLDGLAHILAGLSGGDHTWMVVVLIWFTALCSAFVDNIPMATIMVPVILSLSSGLDMDLNTLAWTMSKGTDIGGIATPIGASANVAGVTIAAREGHAISWRRYCKYIMPAALLVLVMSMVMLLTLH